MPNNVLIFRSRYLDNDQPWEPMFALDPQAGITDPAQRARILGGEAALWSESQDLSNLDSRAWPRAAAIAERLWSPVQTQQAHGDSAAAADAARPRLLQFRWTVSGAPVKDRGPCGIELETETDPIAPPVDAGRR
jgi:hexosaminidase